MSAAPADQPVFANLLPGDPAPWFKQRTPSNPTFTFDSIAGRYVVLCFFISAGSERGKAAFQAVLDNRDLFDDERACFFGVSIDPSDESEARVAQHVPGIRVFWDFDRLVPNIYRPRARKLGFRPAEASTLQMYMNDGNAALKVLNDNLASHPWLLGADPTIADVDVYGVVSYAPEADFDMEQYSHVGAWMARMQSLPGFRPADRLLPRQSAADV